METRFFGDVGTVGLELRASVRLAWTHVAIRETPLVGEPPGESSAFLPTYRVAGAISPLEWLAFRGSVSSGFKLPSLLQLFGNRTNVEGNPGLVQERSLAYDGAVTLRGHTRSGERLRVGRCFPDPSRRRDSVSQDVGFDVQGGEHRRRPQSRCRSRASRWGHAAFPSPKRGHMGAGDRRGQRQSAAGATGMGRLCSARGPLGDALEAALRHHRILPGGLRGQDVRGPCKPGRNFRAHRARRWCRGATFRGKARAWDSEQTTYSTFAARISWAIHCPGADTVDGSAIVTPGSLTSLDPKLPSSSLRGSKAASSKPLEIGRRREIQSVEQGSR